MIPSSEATLSQLAAPPGDRKFSPPNTEKNTRTATRPMKEPVSRRRASIPNDGRGKCGANGTAMSFEAFQGLVEVTEPPPVSGPRPGGRTCGHAASASAGRRAGDGGVDVCGVDDPRPRQDGLGGQVEAVLNEPVEEAQGNIPRQVGLLVDGDQWWPVLDALQAGLAQVEGAELVLVANAGLADAPGRTVGVAGTDGDQAVDGRILEKGCLDRLGDRRG